jgi:hypothetical protein
MHFVSAQVFATPSSHTMQMSGAAQSMSALHWLDEHIGTLNTQSRFASQYEAAMIGAAASQFVPTHGVQESPQDLPSQGALSLQLSMPLVHMPFTQSDHGHTVVPSAHMVQGASLTGHSAAVMQTWPGHVG